MTGRFEQVWAGEREPRLRALPARGAHGDDEPEHEAVRRLRDYAKEQFGKLPAPPTQLRINQTKLRLVERLHRELGFVGSGPSRLVLFETFAAALAMLMERELDVVPPEYAERIVVPAPPPTVLQPQQAMGLLIGDEVG